MQPATGEHGIALLIVVSLLTVIAIMGVAFAFSMHLETQATREFVSTTQARYLAEAGVSDARALLDEDRVGSRTDDRTEKWSEGMSGHDIDVDGDGTLDARWWLVKDANQQVVGRYALQLVDEAGKVNLNVAQADPPAGGPSAINLTTVLERAEIHDPHSVAQKIEQYRDGPDGKPGQAGVDDDGDGTIDEPDEYQPLALRGDDQRLESLEDLVGVVGLSLEEITRLSKIATVYSWDTNMSVTGKIRVNVNHASADELLSVLLEAGVADPWQAAVNIADDADPDFEMSHVTKSSQQLSIANQGSVGHWTWTDDPEGHYQSDGPDDEALSWSIAVPTGTFRLLARGLSGIKVGDVTVEGQLKSSVSDGESLGVFDLHGTVTVRVVNREAAGIPCAFRGIELVSEGAQSGRLIRGIEAVRFNELMVEPVMELKVTDATFDRQNSDWACPVGSAACVNSGGGQGRWSWTSPLLQPGRYYLRVFGATPGQTVGEVHVEGNSQLLVHGQRHPSTALVGSDGKITLTIGKTNPEETYYLKKVTLALQPDAEYVELINLSDREVDVNGWTIDGTLAGGQQARLPAGSVIKAHGLLVAAVDRDDTQTGLAGNSISARTAWDIPAEANVVQLEFPNGGPSPDDDWLKATLPSGTVPRLVLRTSKGAVVDEVQYALPPQTSKPFQSLEKGDPTAIDDRNGDGIDEGWFPSLRLYSPGVTNDNAGMKEVIGLETKVHDPSREVSILNRPLASVGELAGLPSGTAWKPFASTDLAKIVDRLTVEGLRLEAEGHLIAGEDHWIEKGGGSYEYNSTHQPAVVGRWQWHDIPDGHYRLSLYGWMGEQMSVRWELQDGALTEWSPLLSTDAQGRMTMGQITIGMDGTPSTLFTLEVVCGSASGICHLDYIQLDPQLIRVGPINVNTASLDVLRALPGMTDAMVSRIMGGRPFGDREGKGRGIGDLLLGETLGVEEEDKLAAFRQFAGLLTTRSDVFQILSVGQAMSGDRVLASQRIKTVVQR